MTVKRSLSSLLALFFVSLILVSCSGGEELPANEDPNPPGGKKDLFIATHTDLITLDPHLAEDLPSINVTHNIYESLLDLDRNGEPRPLLATAWRAVDETTWEFDLRHGVTFHDGTPFNAEVVKANFERILDPDIASPRRFLFSMIEDVEVIDEHSVRFHTGYSFAPLPAHLAHSGAGMISISSIEADYEAMGEGGQAGSHLARYPSGSGYFRFADREPGSFVRLIRNEAYWGKKPLLDSVTFKVIPDDPLRLSELETGRVHIADPVHPADRERVEEMPLACLDVRLGASLVYIGFNCSKEPFDDVRVRRAVVKAINRERIVEEIYQGLARPAAGPVPPGVFGHDPDLEAIPYDPDGAGELLRQAGYADGFEATIWTNNNQARIEVAEKVRDRLEPLNIDLQVEVREWRDYLAATGRGEHDLFILGWSTPTLDADCSLYSQFHSEHSGPGGNRTFFSNEEVDELLEQARREKDTALRAGLYRDIQDKLLEESPMIFLFHCKDLAGISNKVENLSITPAGIYLLNEVDLKY